METVNISGLNINTTELLEAYENGTLDEVLEDLFKDLDDEEFTLKLDEVVSAIKSAAKELDEISDGKRDEADDYADEGDTIKEKRLTREADELDAFVSDLKDEVADYVMDTANEIDARYIETSEDYGLSTADYKDNEVVHFKSTASAATMEETDASATAATEELTDQDGDGIITYRDQELVDAAAKQELYDTGQHLYITLEEGFVVQDFLISGTTATIEAYSAAEGKTVTFLIENFNENMRLFFNSPDEGFISNTLLSALSEENQKLVFVGDDTNSAFDNLHPVSDADKIAAIQNSTAMLSTETFDSVYDAWASGENNKETIKAAEQAALNRLLSNVNYFEEGSLGFSEVWADIINTDLAGLSSSEQSDVLLSLVMAIMQEGGQDIANLLLTGSVTSLIEGVFIADGAMTVGEKTITMMLETQIEGAVGRYGGADQFWMTSGNDGTGEGTDGEYMSHGILFAINLEGNVTMFGDQELWADTDGTIEALQEYQDAVSGIGWMVDDGHAADYAEALGTTKTEDAKGYSSVVTSDYQAAFGTAIANIDPDDADDLGQDGINVDKYVAEVQTGISAAAEWAAIGGSVADIANQILAYVASISSQDKNHDGDVAAGIIYYLYQACPELVKAMCAEVPGFADKLIGYMESEVSPTKKVDSAINILEKYN